MLRSRAPLTRVKTVMNATITATSLKSQSVANQIIQSLFDFPGNIANALLY